MKRVVIALALASVSYFAAASPTSTQNVSIVSSPATVPVSVSSTVGVSGTVNVGNSVGSPVNVAVVNGPTSQAVNLFHFVPVPANTVTSGLATIYTNGSNGPAVAFTIVSVSLQEAGCALAPQSIWVEVTDISGIKSLVVAPFTGASPGFCGVATVPGTLVVGPGQSLEVDVFTNGIAGSDVSFSASASGYTMS
jgi:hypothetical protein